ncbi:MAG: hypothetical protein J7501_11115 [Bdellovibrio sp.]|nr:hypothetical protein [Bdellovibrio sp.]
MKTVLSFFVTTLFAVQAFPQNSSSDLMCRAKAKEIAASTYSSCVTEARNQQVEQIRANYQKELAALKTKYDKELKKMGGKKAASNTLTTTEVKPSSKSVKGLAKQLPAKSSNQNEATPVQTVTEGEKVVAVGPERSAEVLENDSMDASQVEINDAPAE